MSVTFDRGRQLLAEIFDRSDAIYVTRLDSDDMYGPQICLMSIMPLVNATLVVLNNCTDRSEEIVDFLISRGYPLSKRTYPTLAGLATHHSGKYNTPP